MNTSPNFLIFLFLAFLSSPTHADWIAGFLDEGVTLPYYCKAKSETAGTESERIRAEKYLGKGFSHVHHFCWALAWLWKLDNGIEDKRAGLPRILTNINYLYNKMPSEHPVMREIHDAFARYYTYADDNVKAQKHRSMASSIHRAPSVSNIEANTNSRFTASADRYIQMADRMMQLGIHDEAEALLELALEIEPNSTLIKRKLEKAREAQKASSATTSKPSN